MRCPRCRHENRAGAKFCEECATPLARACANCGAPLSPTAKFCSECAHPAVQAGAERFAAPEAYTPRHLAERVLTSKAALEGERKHVTVLFADTKGSTELIAERDPEEARMLLTPVLEHMMEAVHHYEGTVNQVMGDGIMALFGAPLAHEDHAVRACYAALRMQDAVRRYSDELRRTQGVEVQIRVGLNSGEVVVGSIGSDLRMDYTAVGQTTHLAARMEQLAASGSIRLTADAEAAVQVGEAADHPYTRHFGLMALGLAHLRRGDLLRATAVLERSLDLGRTWQIVLGIPLVAATLGAAYALAGRADEGLPLVVEAVAEFQKCPDHMWPASILLSAAMTCCLAGRIDEATSHAREALALTRGLGARGSEAHALCLAGDVASADGADNAEGYYREALALAGELGMRPLVAHCHLGLGKLSRHVGKREQAREHLTTAAALYREMGMRFWLEQAD